MPQQSKLLQITMQKVNILDEMEQELAIKRLIDGKAPEFINKAITLQFDKRQPSWTKDFYVKFYELCKLVMQMTRSKMLTNATPIPEYTRAVEYLINVIDAKYKSNETDYRVSRSLLAAELAMIYNSLNWMNESLEDALDAYHDHMESLIH